jgi:inner membrane protein
MEPSEGSTPKPATMAANFSFGGPGLKIGLIAILLLFMLFPMHLVANLIAERQARQAETLADFQKSWGATQSLVGPILVVPYESNNGASRSYLHIAPDRLSVDGTLSPEVRRRGLFRSVVYSADVALTGAFRLPSDILPPEPGAKLLWQEATIMLGASDFRGAKSGLDVNWDGKSLPFDDQLRTNSNACGGAVLVAAHPRMDGAPAPERPIPFVIDLNLRGTQALRLTPLGQQFAMKLSGAWSTPNFGGGSAELPSAYRVSDHDFEASWLIANNITRGNGSWLSSSIADCGQGVPVASGAEDQVGVELLEPVPTYRMVERSSKYGILFLVLSFLTYFLFETISGVRIHLMQYGLLGLSLSLFALLLISFSEPLGFAPAYAISTVAILLQASLFTASVTRRRRHALIFAGILGALFGFLYVVLSLETFSLLVGSVALFAVLSAVMAVTRNIDWSTPRATVASMAPSSGEA